MNIHTLLRAVLFGYELLRLLVLAFSFAFFSSLQAALGEGFFPYLVYLSSNALFPLICFFLLLRPREYRNYLPLYMAGKTIAVVLFYTWIVFNLSPGMGFFEPSRVLGGENYTEGMMLLRGAFFISLGDALSVFGTWVLNKKLLQANNLSTEVDGGK